MSSTLEIRHLRLVRALAEEGGPTRAAARLHLTQSAVSHQLAELEGRLGVPLFARVRRTLKLTPAGARLLEAARTVLPDLARVEREVRHAGARRREEFRVVVECFTSYHWLPPVVAALAREHPHVDVRIALGAAREPIAALLRGDVEIALVSSPVRDRELEVEPLFDDEWAVIVAPSHSLAARAYVGAADLGGGPLLVHDAPRSDVERLRELVAAEGAVMPRASRVPLTEAIVELVKAGLGLGLVSSWAVAPHVERGDVVARRLTRAGLPETWSAVYRRDAALRFPLARFAGLVRACPPPLAALRPRRRPRSEG
jgi:LysR family transcriptional regulator, regulator for metE and metH